MPYRETPLFFDCRGDALAGVITEPMADALRIGVLIVVGGPQYRVGSHRQFVHLARRLAEHGFTAMRFDVRGMGDSEGSHPGYEAIHSDIAAAIAAFLANCTG